MKSKHLLLTFILVLGGMWSQNTYAVSALDTVALIKQDSISARSLVISEMGSDWRGYNEWAYAELANTGDITLDMSRFIVFYPSWGRWYEPLILDAYETGNKMRLSGTLAPGETYLIIQRERNLSEDPYGEMNYPNGYTNFEADAMADLKVKRWGAPLTDPAVTEKELLGLHMGVLYSNVIKAYSAWDTTFLDSIFVDRFGVVKVETSANDIGFMNEFPIAGVIADQPWNARIYVRKFQVKQGNVIPKTPEDVYNDIHISKWDASRGTDISDSEWIPLPRSMDREYDKIFTTVGYHGENPEYSVTSSAEGVSIDTDGEMITLPYGVSRDSVFRLFETGLNHAWELKLGADTGQFFVQPDDSIFFYTVGTDLVTKKYGVTITKEESKVALVAPLVYKNDDGAFVRRYDMSSGEEPMDTIGTLPFDLEIDTFFTYMVKEENATWEIIPADGQKRPEIREGDILKVTSEDASIVKEYYLGVETFFPNHNADLSTIYFPGLEVFENPETYMPTDTLIGFNPSGTLYSVDVPGETMVSPPIVATKENSRSRVEVKRAKNIRGSEEDRTATIVVTAEDDTTIKEYKIIFNVDRETPPVQGSIFITDVATGWGATNQNHNVQFFNPTNDLIDLTDYVYIGYDVNKFGNIATAFQNDSNWLVNNGNVFRFGSIVEPAEDGTPVFKTDLVQDKILLEGKETFSMATRGGYGAYGGPAPEEVDKYVDLIVGHNNISSFGSWWSNKYLAYADYKYGSRDPWGSGYLPLGKCFDGSFSFRIYNKSWASPWFGIARILNDSVKDGTKHVFSDFENDYEWVDQFGGPNRTNTTMPYLFENDTFLDLRRKGLDAGVYRKPWVYTGEPIDSKSFGIADEVTHKTYHENEWVYYGVDFSNPDAASRISINYNDEGTGLRDIRDARIKNHVMITYAHISYLTSSIYLMAEGLEGPQDVTGVTAGTTVEQFLGNVNKADTGMVVKVFGADGVTEVSGSDPIVAGTQVWSWSANGMDSVNYVITNLGALASDCDLSSSDYTVTKDGATGNVSGIKIGTTLEQILEKVSAPATATMMFTDGKEQNLPLYKYNADTIAIQNLQKSAVLASEMVFIEVIAQDKVSKCLYSLTFDAEDNPFLLSDVYVIDNDEKVINFVWRTSPGTLLANLIPSTGASVKVVNKYDQERTLGVVVYSDRVILSKDGKDVSYWLKFSSEEEIIGVANKEVEVKGLSLYPNPTTDVVRVRGFENIQSVELRDITGKLISKVKSNLTEPVIDMKQLTSGVYIIVVDADAERTSMKVIKE